MQTKALRPLLIRLFVLVSALAACGYAFILNSSTGLPIKWPPGTIPLVIKLGSSQTLSDGTTYNSSAQAAAASWNTILGGAQFTTTTAASGTATDGNSINEVVFSSSIYGKSFGSGTLAVTTTWYSGNERIEGDTLFNTAYTWNSYRGTKTGSAYDIQRVAIHELGHTLGLDHPDEAGQSVSAIMNSTISSIDALTTDDTSGAQQIYGPGPYGTKPSNDNFANAESWAFASVVLNTATTITATGYTVNATKETGEPSHAGNAGGHSVWYKWTPQYNGAVTITTKGSYFDTTLAVYTGTAVSALTTIASNDDITDGTVQASSLSYTATAGTTYYIAIDGYDGDEAAYTLKITYTPESGVAPSITTQPSSVTVTSGSSASFTVAASGTSPLSYQWYLGSSAISGATSATYSISSATSSQAGSYSVVVTNAYGSATSNSATLTVNSASSTSSASSSGGGGGGGAPSTWCFGLLGALALIRKLSRLR